MMFGDDDDDDDDDDDGDADGMCNQFIFLSNYFPLSSQPVNFH